MNPTDMRKSLQLFHALEVHQVGLYKAQAALASCAVDRHMLTRAAEIETGHIEKLHAALAQRGWNVLPGKQITALTGGMVGALTGISWRVALRANIAIERMAVYHYSRFINVCDDEEIRDLLWMNMMDESLHVEWFKARLAQDADLPVVD